MDIEQKNENLKNMLDRVYEQLSYAETKNGVLLGVFGAIAAILAGFIVADIPCWLMIFLGITAIVFLAGMLICIWSFFPNTKVLDGSPRPNFYSWIDMANFKNTKDFLDNIEDTENFDEHILAQCIQVSRIIRRKHHFFVNALYILVAGIFPPFWIFFAVKTIKKCVRKKEIIYNAEEEKKIC